MTAATGESRSAKARRLRAMLRARLATGRMLVIPGAHDPISAMLVERAGFEAAYVGSYSTAASLFGYADTGLLGMSETVTHAAAIAAAIDIPLLADAEDGWGNAANIWRTVQAFEDAGVAGIHIEDHVFGKHTEAPARIADLDEALGKIRAALDARTEPDFLIIARTDIPWATNDLEECVRRLNAFTDAGVDYVMPAGIRAPALATIRHRLRGKIVMTDKPGTSVSDEEQAGADIMLYYGLTIHAAFHGVESALARFRETNDLDAVPGTRDCAKAFEQLVDYGSYVERSRRYGS